MPVADCDILLMFPRNKSLIWNISGQIVILFIVDRKWKLELSGFCQLKWDLGHWDKDLLTGKNVSFDISMDGCRY